MLLTTAGLSCHDAALNPPAGTPAEGSDDTPNQDEATPDAAIAETPLPSRRAPASPVNPIRNERPYPVNDPCTYLG